MGHLPKVIASYLSHLIDMKTNLSKGYFCLFVSCAGYLFETKKNQIFFFFGQKLDSETKGDSWAPYNRIIFGMLDTLRQIIENCSVLLILHF